MAVQTIIRNTVNLEEPIAKKILSEPLGSLDNQAHRFEVSVKRGSEAVDLTGAMVNGYFIRGGGETVMLTGGVEDGKAYVVLSDSCYRTPGHFSFAMKVQVGDVRHTVLWYEGSVGQTSTDSMVDPENIVPSLEELLAQIGVAEQAADRANQAADSASQFANMTVEAVTLGNDADATASFENGVLTIGLPKGPKGDTGSASPIKVNGKEAIDDNITLTAEDVGALPNSYEAPVKSVNGQTGDVVVESSSDAEMLGGKLPGYFLNPHNLLDNSDFTNPVNQRGGSSYETANAHGIDRWIVKSGSTLTVNSGSITVAGMIKQRIPNLSQSGTYTLAVGLKDGSVQILNTHGWDSEDSCYYAEIPTGEYVWAVLFAGEYTTGTIPPYAPKGYAVELAECQGYFRILVNAQGYCSNTNNLGYIFPGFVMRSKPVATVKKIGSIRCAGTAVTPTGVSDVNLYEDSLRVVFSGTFDSGLNNAAAALYGAEIELSCDP